jgi:hypothetical protein
MASRHEISCINKIPRNEPHERIKNVGGVNSNGERWKLSQPLAVEGMESGKWIFFVRANVREVEVVIRESQYGHKYLTTEPDGESQNNLLSLPECP